MPIIRKRKGSKKVSLISFENPINVLNRNCLVAYINKNKRLWIVPKTRRNKNKSLEKGYEIMGTLFTGDSPKGIGFAYSAEDAKNFLSSEFRVPTDIWKVCPLISLQRAGAVS